MDATESETIHAKNYSNNYGMKTKVANLSIVLVRDIDMYILLLCVSLIFTSLHPLWYASRL